MGLIFRVITYGHSSCFIEMIDFTSFFATLVLVIHVYHSLPLFEYRFLSEISPHISFYPCDSQFPGLFFRCLLWSVKVLILYFFMFTGKKLVIFLILFFLFGFICSTTATCTCINIIISAIKADKDNSE